MLLYDRFILDDHGINLLACQSVDEESVHLTNFTVSFDVTRLLILSAKLGDSLYLQFFKAFLAISIKHVIDFRLAQLYLIAANIHRCVRSGNLLDLINSFYLVRLFNLGHEWGISLLLYPIRLSLAKQTILT